MGGFDQGDAHFQLTKHIDLFGGRGVVEQERTVGLCREQNGTIP